MKKSDLKSAIQPEFRDLILTGEYAVHHVFGGNGRRRICEKYGFLVAVRPAMHDEIHAKTAAGKYVDKVLKRQCYEYWRKSGGTDENFVSEFGPIPDRFSEIEEEDA